MNDAMTLAKVLESADELPWNEALYLPASRDWTLESPAMVWDPDDVADDEQEVPEVVKERGMVYVLGVSSVQDIISNARQQKANCSTGDKFDALMYYVRHDAFIELT